MNGAGPIVLALVALLAHAAPSAGWRRPGPFPDGDADRVLPKTEPRPGEVWTSRPFGRFHYVPRGSFGPTLWNCILVVTRGFYMQEHEVTVAEWRAVMGWVPERAARCGEDCPATYLSREQVRRFLEALSRRDGSTYRLPTIAEALVARSWGMPESGLTPADLDARAWWGGNSGRRVHPVCTRARDGLGLCDLAGNAREYTADEMPNVWWWWEPTTFEVDPVLRGGYVTVAGCSAFSDEDSCTFSLPLAFGPEWRHGGPSDGLRLVRDVPR